MRWICLFLLLIPSLGCGRSSTPLPMTIGHVTTLTGLEKRPGEQASLGLRLALDDINKSETDNPIHVRHADAQGQLDAFEAQAVRLVAVQRCWGLIGGTTTPEVLRLDKSKLSLDGTSIPLPILALTGYRTPGMSDQVFLTGMSPEFQGQILGRYALDDLKLRQAVVVADERSEEAVVRAEGFMKGWEEAWAKKYPQELVARPRFIRISTATKDIDWKTVQFAPAKEEAVVFAGSRKDFFNLPRSEAGSTLFFLGDEGELQPRDLGPKDVVFTASAFALEPDQAANRDFVEKFKAAFKQDPDPAAAVAFDDIRILVRALREGKKEGKTLEKAREELRKTKDFPGVTGPLSFDGQQRLQRPLFVMRVDPTTSVMLKKVSP